MDSKRSEGAAKSLAAGGLDRLARAIGNDYRVTLGPRIGGGVAAKTHRLTLHGPDGSEQSLLLKRYPVGNDTAQLEWDRLGSACRVGLPTPRRVAFDASGTWFGEPALVMTMLPGRADLFPADVDSWTRELARALATIHRTNLGTEIPPVLRRPHMARTWRLWDIAPDARIVSATAALERLQQSFFNEPEVFCHDDFHPGNVLFEGQLVSGVVDWSSARLAPAVADVSNMRAELAIAPGGESPDQFLEHYRGISNAPLERLGLWDVLSGMHVLEFSQRRIDSFASLGVHLRAHEVRASIERFLDNALTRC
jgi:aminoglycoside phosphotransferase (APT) family kinase protein